MIPWLAKSDQKAIFPDGLTFNSPEEQEQYVRNWAEKRTGFESNFKVTFYPGRYAAEKGSILPVGDPTAYISDAEVSPPLYPSTRAAPANITPWSRMDCFCTGMWQHQMVLPMAVSSSSLIGLGLWTDKMIHGTVQIVLLFCER